MKSVEIDVNDPYIKRLYIAAARVPKFSIEYSCEDISHIMLKIEKAVWAWEKENQITRFFQSVQGVCWIYCNLKNIEYVVLNRRYIEPDRIMSGFYYVMNLIF